MRSASTGSPAIDLTGQRCSETTVPAAAGMGRAVWARISGDASGPRRRRRGDRADRRDPPARGRRRGGRRRARSAGGHDLGRRRGALVPVPRVPAGAGRGLVRARVRRHVRAGRRAGQRRSDAVGARARRARAADPWWRDAVPTFARTQDGWRFAAPVADMSVHLPWLVGRLEALRGAGTAGAFASLDEPLARAPVVVDCAGLGARELAGDESLLAVRGQILRVECPAIDEWFLDQADAERLVYVVPRERDVVLGGTAVDDDEDPAVRADTAAAIRARCEAAVPALRGARVVGEAVGLRPARPAVRLEAEARAGGTVVHCYGHGGAGVTLAWGCAEEVSRLVRRALG